VPTFTSSRYTVSAATISANTSLTALRNAMLQVRPDHAQLTGGWASIEDAGSNLRVPNAAPPVSDPELWDDEGDYPERLVARFYFFRRDAQLVKALPQGSEQEHHYLDAVDVIVSAVTDHTKTFQVLFASGNGSILNGFVRALRALVAGIDEKGTVRHDGAAIGFNPDLFLWLLVRARDDKQIDPSTEIQDVLATSARDNTRRSTMLSDGVDFDRPSFLVAVAEIDQLGPVRVVLRDEELKAKVTTDVFAGGKFSVRKRETHYQDVVGDPETRLASLQDFAYVLLPKVITAYNADTSWPSVRRSAEIRAAAQSLIVRYEQKIADFDAANAAAAVDSDG